MGKANQKVVNHNQFSLEQFVAKWSKAQLSERAASHEHFIDLCRLLDQPTPAEATEAGRLEMFEKKSPRRDDFRNRLIWGDNKLFMALLLKEFKGKIDLIYMDPPLDVGADFTGLQRMPSFNR